MRGWILAGVVLVVVLAAWAAYAAINGGLPVEAAHVVRGEISEFIDERGKTRLPKVHLITMPIDGRIAEITVDENTEVAEGEMVAQIVPKDLDLMVAVAEAVVERLGAAIRESADTTVEQTGFEQTVELKKSMEAAVKAARNRERAGLEKLDFAEKQLGRTLQLFQKGQATQEEVDQARLDKVEADVDYKQDQLVTSATEAMYAATALMPEMVTEYIQRKILSTAVLEKQRAEAEFQLQQILQNEERGVMHSPVDGVVLERMIENERYLTAGTVLLRIGKLDRLEVEAEVLSQDVVRVKPGNPVAIYGPAIGEEPVTGRVREIYPAGFTKVSSLGVEQQRVKVIIEFAPEAREWVREYRSLGVDYRVRVRIYTATDEDALVVPRSALFRGGAGGWEVFAVRGGVARLQEVQVGLMNDELAEITDGLAEGDTVVLAPETELTDGTRVRPLVREARVEEPLMD